MFINGKYIFNFFFYLTILKDLLFPWKPFDLGYRVGLIILSSELFFSDVFFLLSLLKR